MVRMAKTTSINLRIAPEFRREIETLADFHGLSMSSYAHSLLVKAVRQAVADTPHLFVERELPVYTKPMHKSGLPAVTLNKPATRRKQRTG